MNLLLLTLLRAILVPAAIAAGLGLLLRRVEALRRHAAAVPWAAALASSYGLLSFRTPLPPERAWHWTVPLGVAGAIIGPALRAGGLRPVERLLLNLLAGHVAAHCLVPGWRALEAVRPWLVLGLGGGLGMSAALLAELPPRLGGRSLLAAQAVSAALVAAAAAATLSISYGEACGLAAAAAAGVLLGARACEEAAAGLAWGWSVVVGGWAFNAAIEPIRPLWGVLLLAAAPCGMAIGAVLFPRPVGSAALGTWRRGVAIWLPVVLCWLGGVGWLAWDVVSADE